MMEWYIEARARPGTGSCFRPVAGALALALIASPAVAQTDYFNLDKNRPVRIEDAAATERYAFEVKVAPLRLERDPGGIYEWGFDPEIAYGILPRTNIEIGFPFAFTDGPEGVGRRSGLTGIELSAFHNLNNETLRLPALALRGDVVLPVGRLSGERVQPAVTGIVTRSFRPARLHVNGQYTFGAEPAETGADSDPHGASRWLAGLAVDRAFPLEAYLLVADVYAAQPLRSEDPVEWNAGAGIRYQVNPYLAVDAGVGRRLTGVPTWFLTLGSAYHFGLPWLIRSIR